MEVKKSVVMGQEEACLSADDSTWFIDNLSEAKGKRESDLKTCADRRLPINPSDHFGVLTWFGSMSRTSRAKSLPEAERTKTRTKTRSKRTSIQSVSRRRRA